MFMKSGAEIHSSGRDIPKWETREQRNSQKEVINEVFIDLHILYVTYDIIQTLHNMQSSEDTDDNNHHNHENIH